MTDILGKEIVGFDEAVYLKEMGFNGECTEYYHCEEHDDEWQRNKRGMLYKWVDNETILKAGERSLYVLQRCGIELTETEFEAIKINDKTDDDKFSMLHITPLSMIVKMADDLSYMRVNYKQKNK